MPMSDVPSHRKKVHRYDEPGHARFLTFSCYHRLPLLSKDRSRRWFADALAAARLKHGFELWAWVIMPEHVHLILWPRPPVPAISAILQAIKQPVGQRALAFLETNGVNVLHRSG